MVQSPWGITVLIVPFFGLGVCSHLGYFIRGDHCVRVLSYVSITITAPSILWMLLVFYQHLPWLDGAGLVATMYTSFMTGLMTSIFLYRAYFHPLRKFPGPFPARVTKLWHVAKNVRGEHHYQLLDKLHKTYGDIVRTGPNELSIIDCSIIDACFGPRSTCGKTEWYSAGLPMTTVHQMRDRALHDKRRKTGWDPAFGTKSLRAYDPRIIEFADKLMTQLESFGGKPVNATKWCHFLGYDVMGALGFGRSFNTLESGESHFAIDICAQGQGALRYISAVPWLTHTLTQLPSFISPIKRLLDYSDDCVQQRRAAKQDSSDIISHLIQSEHFFNDPTLDHMLLTGDSRLVIIAGSDTTSATLAYACSYLAKDKSIVQKLRKELADAGITNPTAFSVPALQNLKYMNGVINETLRLHPPVPGGVFRLTPPEGLRIGKISLPGNINLLTPHYSLHRSPKNFPMPDAFIPERWSTQPELILTKDAFMPFSAGPYGCIGKHLAYNEIRTVIAKMILRFDISLAPGETGDTLFDDAIDMFTVIPGALMVCFNQRK